MAISGGKTFFCDCDEKGCRETYEDLAQDEDEFIDQLKASDWTIVDRDNCYCPKHKLEK